MEEREKNDRDAAGPISPNPNMLMSGHGLAHADGNVIGPKGVNKKKVKRSYKSKAPGTKIGTAVNEQNEVRGTEVEISSMSIRDSNIENMSRLIISRLNSVLADIIWEVGTHLGVHSGGEDHVEVQRIEKMLS
ncbi:hypothetical protein Ancab_018552 [Ancistrocladus abbreviatus]